MTRPSPDVGSPRGEAAITVDSLYKDYGGVLAVAGLSFAVRRGEVFALLGPNGAGKTTTVEILEGFRAPTSGTVRVLGHDPSTRPLDLRRRIGVVLQECGFPAHLRVAELLDAWRGYYERALPREELLELVELADQRAALVQSLSGGQRRRLDLALALAGDPELVFLDEPTTGFDPEARRRCWQAIRNMRDLGKTVLLTTHYLDEADQLADRVAIVTSGKLRALGTPLELSRQARIPARIRFRSPASSLDPAASLPATAFAREGDYLVVPSLDPATTMRSLLDWADRERTELDDLSIAPPSLDEAYLALVATETREP